MKKRVWIVILCIAAVSLLTACNQTDEPTPVKPEVAYKDTLVDFGEILSAPDSE